MFVNIAAVPLNTLNLTRVALAGIFAGVITRWDDPEILNANPTITASQLNSTVTVRDRATAYAHACRRRQRRRLRDAHYGAAVLQCFVRTESGSLHSLTRR